MPIIHEEYIGKIVGRRRSPGRIGEVGSTIKSKQGWARFHGRPLVPKGVYRFTSHEEADLWMTKMMVRQLS
jgi:hypothetical protein